MVIGFTCGWRRLKSSVQCCLTKPTIEVDFEAFSPGWYLDEEILIKAIVPTHWAVSNARLQFNCCRWISIGWCVGKFSDDCKISHFSIRERCDVIDSRLNIKHVDLFGVSVLSGPNNAALHLGIFKHKILKDFSVVVIVGIDGPTSRHYQIDIAFSTIGFNLELSERICYIDVVVIHFCIVIVSVSIQGLRRNGNAVVKFRHFIEAWWFFRSFPTRLYFEFIEVNFRHDREPQDFSTWPRPRIPHRSIITRQLFIVIPRGWDSIVTDVDIKPKIFFVAIIPLFVVFFRPSPCIEVSHECVVIKFCIEQHCIALLNILDEHVFVVFQFNGLCYD